MIRAWWYARAVVSANDWYPVKVAAGCVIGGFTLWACLYFAAKSASLGYSMAVASAAVISGVIVVAARQRPGPQLPEEPPAESAPPNEDLYFLEYRLSSAKKDRARFEQRVRPLLVGLAEERLARRHGVNWRREPDKAQAIVGEQVWALIAGEPDTTAKAPSAREVGQWVDRIEAI